MLKYEVTKEKEFMNILVTGAKGQLGKCISDLVTKSSSIDNYFFTDIDELDITDADSVNRYVSDNSVQIIINCAAYTNVDKAEEPTEKEKVFAVNTKAVSNLANAAMNVGAWLFHISTDYVFGGNINNQPCKETQMPNPTGVYGESKLKGEEAIKLSGAKSLIFRTAWLYSEYGNNFMMTIQNLISKRESIKVVFDQCGTPTYARDLAKAILDIINERNFENNEGLYHFSNEGVCSWYDFAINIQKLSGNTSCEISPCHSSEFPSNVVRPSYSVLDKTKYKEIFKKTIPYWIDSLAKCISNQHLKTEQ